MKVCCMNCGGVANWFVKRRKDVSQIGDRKVLYFCNKCFKFKRFGEKIFPPALYWRYYAPKGIRKKIFKELDFEELIKKLKPGLERGRGRSLK